MASQQQQQQGGNGSSSNGNGQLQQREQNGQVDQSQQQQGQGEGSNGSNSKDTQDPQFSNLQKAAQLLSSRANTDSRIEQATELSEVLNCKLSGFLLLPMRILEMSCTLQNARQRIRTGIY